MMALDKTRIVIDPGHGGSETGAVANGYVEKELNLKTALFLKEFLEQYQDVEVIMTRTTDKELSLKQRGDIAKQNKADLLISVHFNAYDSSAKGFEAIYSYGCAKSKLVAEQILWQVTKLGLWKRGIWTKKSSHADVNYYGVLRHTAPIPCLIVEGLFLTNKDDIKFLEDNNFLRNLAEAYATGIANQLRLERKGPEMWKKKIVEDAFDLGLITDKAWIEKADEVATVWFVLAVAINILKKLPNQKEK